MVSALTWKKRLQPARVRKWGLGGPRFVVGINHLVADIWGRSGEFWERSRAGWGDNQRTWNRSSHHQPVKKSISGFLYF